MRIVADENIPLIENYFGGYDQLILKSGRSIVHSDLVDADILLVRSVTRVNQALLKNTTVKFVGSATSGADHLDTRWLEENHIKWSAAQGCNATAVVEYVVCVIAALQKMSLLNHKKVRAAVVGVGRIGQQVADKCTLLGFDVVLCDPLRPDITPTSFESLTDLDFITFHTPLTKTGDHPTYHLVQKEFLERQKKNCILLNAGRGEVFAFDQLKKHGKQGAWCLDVWEGEPHIDVDVLEQALIATPHIAGYSLQSKYRGTEMIYQAALKNNVLTHRSVSPLIYPTKKISVESAKDWRDVVLSIFNPIAETVEMKRKLTEDPHCFEMLRKKFFDRYEFNFIELENIKLPEADRILLKQLGFGSVFIEASSRDAF